MRPAAVGMDRAVEPVPMPGDPHPHPAGDDAPVTPHATPRRDAEGRLTYIGEDGRRYIVAPPPHEDPAPQDG